MRQSARRVLAGVAAIAVVGIAGCGGEPTPTDVTSDVDRERAALLASDPIVQAALAPPRVQPGLVHNELMGWNRTEVTAEIYLSEGLQGPAPEAVEHEVAAAVAVLRKGGWTIHWEMCLPEPVYDMQGDLLEKPIPVEVPRVDGHEWLAAGHKISDGVSYWVLVAGGLLIDGTAFVDVTLRAPNARDVSNLLPVPPDPVAGESRCAEDGKIGTDIEQAGTPTVIRDWWPFPAQQRSRDPHLV